MTLQKSVFPIKISKILIFFEKPTHVFFRLGPRNTFFKVDFPLTNPPNPTRYDRFRLSRSLQKKTLTARQRASRWPKSHQTLAVTVFRLRKTAGGTLVAHRNLACPREPGRDRFLPTLGSLWNVYLEY